MPFKTNNQTRTCAVKFVVVVVVFEQRVVLIRTDAIENLFSSLGFQSALYTHQFVVGTLKTVLKGVYKKQSMCDMMCVNMRK